MSDNSLEEKIEDELDELLPPIWLKTRKDPPTWVKTTNTIAYTPNSGSHQIIYDDGNITKEIEITSQEDLSEQVEKFLKNNLRYF